MATGRQRFAELLMEARQKRQSAKESVKSLREELLDKPEQERAEQEVKDLRKELMHAQKRLCTQREGEHRAYRSLIHCICHKSF